MKRFTLLTLFKRLRGARLKSTLLLFGGVFFFYFLCEKQTTIKMDWTTIVSALLGALFGGGGVWLINLYTAPEKKKQGQIANLITIIESQDATIKNLIARQDAYEDRVNRRISETMSRALENEHRLTRLENGVHRARLCKFNTAENPCPVLVYIDDKQEQENYCSNCQHNGVEKHG